MLVHALISWRPINLCDILFSHPCIDTGSFSIGSVVGFQSDGTPLLSLCIQVMTDNGMSYLS